MMWLMGAFDVHLRPMPITFACFIRSLDRLLSGDSQCCNKCEQGKHLPIKHFSLKVFIMSKGDNSDLSLNMHGQTAGQSFFRCWIIFHLSAVTWMLNADFPKSHRPVVGSYSYFFCTFCLWILELLTKHLTSSHKMALNMVIYHCSHVPNQFPTTKKIASLFVKSNA